MPLFLENQVYQKRIYPIGFHRISCKYCWIQKLHEIKIGVNLIWRLELQKLQHVTFSCRQEKLKKILLVGNKICCYHIAIFWVAANTQRENKQSLFLLFLHIQKKISLGYRTVRKTKHTEAYFEQITYFIRLP